MKTTWETDEWDRQWAYYKYNKNLSSYLFTHMESNVAWLVSTFAPKDCQVKSIEVFKKSSKRHKVRREKSNNITRKPQTKFEITLEDMPSGDNEWERDDMVLTFKGNMSDDDEDKENENKKNI